MAHLPYPDGGDSSGWPLLHLGTPCSVLNTGGMKRRPISP
jgi:hypothetical protein